MEIRNGRLTDLESVYGIEYANFGQDVAMARETMAAYLAEASETFLVMMNGEEVAGYIMGPLVPEADLVDDYYFSVPEKILKPGYVAITSLSVAELYQGQGVGTTLLAAMKDFVIAAGHQGIVLTCQENLVSYYEMNGFIDLGPSESQLGHLSWIKMVWYAEN